MAVVPTILLCSPTFFTVDYAINPWMQLDRPVDVDLAKSQWQLLKQAITQVAGAAVIELPPVDGLPDLVFTANAAFIHDKVALIARFKFPERQGEEAYTQAWFAQQGFTTHTLPPDLPLEGAGDALTWRLSGHSPMVFAGYGPRSALQAHAWITQTTGLPVVSLALVDARYYHVDTCLCPLDTGELLYYPGAFDPVGLAAIEQAVPESLRIVVDADEASRFACNAVSIGDHVVLNQGSPKLEAALRARGKTVTPVDLSEFLKSGGSAKCLTLRLA
jgi:N-dimethylarginine dimethylaminohydrolase